MQKSSVRQEESSLKRALPLGPGFGSRVARHRRIAATAACVAVLGLFGTACAGSGDDSGDKDGNGSTARGGGKTDEDQAVAWRKCLRDNGVDIPEPKGGDGAMPGIRMNKENQAATQKAFKACKDKAPKNGPGSEMTQEKKDALVKYAKCMRKQGIDMPVPEEGKVNALPMPSTAAEKKAYEKAGKACEDVRP